MSGPHKLTSDFHEFADLLGYPFEGDTNPQGERMHVAGDDYKKNAMADLYAPGSIIGIIVGLLPLYDILLHMFRHTIAPNAGNTDDIRGGLVNLIVYAHSVFMGLDDDTAPNSHPIDVMVFIFQEMHYSVFKRKTPPYAPYVMKLIKLKYPLSPEDALDVGHSLDCEEHKPVKLNKKSSHMV